MMMPANFSVMAENELTYVVGGSAVTDFAKTLNTNLVTMIGNTYVNKLVEVTLGTMFGGAWGASGSVSMSDAMSTAFYKTAAGQDQNGFNKVLSTIGLGAAVYQLGTATAKNAVSKVSKTPITDDEGNTKKYKSVLAKYGKTPIFLAWL